MSNDQHEDQDRFAEAREAAALENLLHALATDPAASHVGESNIDAIRARWDAEEAAREAETTDEMREMEAEAKVLDTQIDEQAAAIKAQFDPSEHREVALGFYLDADNNLATSYKRLRSI